MTGGGTLTQPSAVALLGCSRLVPERLKSRNLQDSQHKRSLKSRNHVAQGAAPKDKCECVNERTGMDERVRVSGWASAGGRRGLRLLGHRSGGQAASCPASEATTAAPWRWRPPEGKDRTAGAAGPPCGQWWPLAGGRKGPEPVEASGFLLHSVLGRVEWGAGLGVGRARSCVVPPPASVAPAVRDEQQRPLHSAEHRDAACPHRSAAGPGLAPVPAPGASGVTSSCLSLPDESPGTSRDRLTLQSQPRGPEWLLTSLNLVLYGLPHQVVE